MIKIFTIILLGILILYGCDTVNYENRATTLSTNKPQVEDKDQLLTKCEMDFKYYVDISEKKYDISISLLKIEKIDNTNSIDEFSKTWGTGANSDIELDEIEKQFPYRYKRPELRFPIVLFATKFKGLRGQVPMVIACDNDGKIMNNSKQTLISLGQVLSIT